MGGNPSWRTRNTWDAETFVIRIIYDQLAVCIQEKLGFVKYPC